MFAVALALFAAMPAGARAAGEEPAGGGSTPGEVGTESPGGSTEPPSTGWTGGGGSTGTSSGGGGATPGASLGSGGGQKSAGSTGGEHSSNTGSSGHSGHSAPEPTYSAPEPSSTPSSEGPAKTPSSSGNNGPARAGKDSHPPATKRVPVRIGIGAASAVAVSKPPPAANGSLTPGPAVRGASSRDQVASGSDGLPFWVVILLALILVGAGGLGVWHWARRRKQAAGQESRSTTPRGVYDGVSGGQTARRRRLGVRRPHLPSVRRPHLPSIRLHLPSVRRPHLPSLRMRTHAARPMRGYSESVSEMFASSEGRAAMASERTKRSNLPWRRLARLRDRDSQRQF